ncbi:WYL domain-containing protein [Staphylococcus aureus]
MFFYFATEPRIIYWKNKWYLVAYCHLRDDV